MPTEDTNKGVVSDDAAMKPAPEDNGAGDTAQSKKPKEIGGRKGLDPTRYGDWEKAGRCIDF